jgi:uncharacterized membrane protein YfcA
VLIPLLLFVPPALALPALDMRQAAAMTVVQVMVASTAGFLAHRRRGMVHPRLALWMGPPVMAGAWVGAVVSAVAPQGALLRVFGLLALAAGTLMFLPPPHAREAVRVADVAFSGPLAAVAAFAVGALAGLIGVGGAFMLVPLMIYVLGVPTRITIGTSLAIVLLSSAAAFAGRLATGQIDAAPAAALAAGAWPGAWMGARLGERVSAALIRRLLGVFILASAVRVLFTR